MKQSHSITFSDELQPFERDGLHFVFLAFQGFDQFVYEIFFWILSCKERAEECTQLTAEQDFGQTEQERAGIFKRESAFFDWGIRCDFFQ